MSEQTEQSIPNSLDVVKARIFYLACDVEVVSPPAAMLLRAVADAIEDNSEAEPITAARMLKGNHSLLHPEMLNLRPFGSQGRGAA